MDQMRPSHSRNSPSGHPYHSNRGRPYQRDLNGAYQKNWKVRKQLSMDSKRKETKKLECTNCQLEFPNQKMLDHHNHDYVAKHRKLINSNKLLEKLKKTESFTYDSVKGTYLCLVCNIESKSPRELENHFYRNTHLDKTEFFKDPPLRSDNTPCQYINPYFKADTCLAGIFSSNFWIDLINTVYVNLTPTNKQMFVEDMISQAHGCLHMNSHLIIVKLIFNGNENNQEISMKLQKAYHRKNMTLSCDCERWITQEELDEVRGITSKKFPPEDQKHLYIVNPYLGDTTCDGAEKSSLFWLDKIREVFHNLSDNNQKKFMSNMKTQAHACLHKGYHSDIIEALTGNKKSCKNKMDIKKLIKKYESFNCTFVCTCETGLSQKVLMNGNTKEYCTGLDSPETKEEFTYESILEILELDD